MHIHPAAQAGYENAAEAYDRGRPTYPAQAIAFLLRELRIHQKTELADLGAGTGKFTRLLAPHAVVTAIEPVAAMRERLVAHIPDIEVLDGTAEDIPLATNTMDVLTVAQAFHWFNGEVALKEIARVLKPGGRLALVWNQRDPNSRWNQKLEAVFARYEGETPRYVSMRWKEAFKGHAAFPPLQHRAFPFVQIGNVETMVDRVGSVSFISALPEAERAKVAAEVREIFADQPATFEIPYTTNLYWSQRN